MIVDYDCKELKPYKGYDITKIWDITARGQRVNTQYQVSEGEDAINYFPTLREAKKYIDTVLV